MWNLRKLNSILQRHPARVYNGGEKQFISGIEVCTGSLGYSMSIAVGISIGLKMDKKSSFVYVICSDGEHQKGSTWEEG